MLRTLNAEVPIDNAEPDHIATVAGSQVRVGKQRAVPLRQSKLRGKFCRRPGLAPKLLCRYRSGMTIALASGPLVARRDISQGLAVRQDRPLCLGWRISEQSMQRLTRGDQIRVESDGGGVSVD